MYSQKLALFMLFTTLLFSGCVGTANVQGNAPEQIATFPQNTPVRIAPAPAYVIVVYQAYMEIQVNNVDHASETATQLAYQYGGYLASSQSWYIDNRKNTTIVLEVPTVNFDSLHASLLSLGMLNSESVTSELVQNKLGYGQIPYSQITIHFLSRAPQLPILNLNSGWDPGQTFQRAWNVFVKVFGFIADIAIWITVVGGPFFLVFIIFRVLVRRFRNRP